MPGTRSRPADPRPGGNRRSPARSIPSLAKRTGSARTWSPGTESSMDFSVAATMVTLRRGAALGPEGTCGCPWQEGGRPEGEPVSLTIPDVLEETCTTRQALERLASKWRVLLIYALLAGPQRHSQLRRRLPGISQKVLTESLREMERDGLVHREVLKQTAP